MFYMPGIDGTGLAAYRQFPRLTSAFDLRCLIVPRTDRSTFEQLVEDVSVSSMVSAPGSSCSYACLVQLRPAAGSHHAASQALHSCSSNAFVSSPSCAV